LNYYPRKGSLEKKAITIKGTEKMEKIEFDGNESMVLVLHEMDNTVTALEDLKKGQQVVHDGEAGPETFTLQKDVAYAHKFARSLIPKGSDVLKYGEVIGVATADIHPGEHVHVHNVDSKRA
jgi:altronate dehydratase small subunit